LTLKVASRGEIAMGDKKSLGAWSPRAPMLTLVVTVCATIARAGCFVPGTDIPLRQTLLAERHLSAPARHVAQALFDYRLDRGGTSLAG
jgi:hypothetical protein